MITDIIELVIRSKRTWLLVSQSQVDFYEPFTGSLSHHRCLRSPNSLELIHPCPKAHTHTEQNACRAMQFVLIHITF